MRAWLPPLLILTVSPLLWSAAPPAAPTEAPGLFDPPRRPAVPAVKDTAWPRNAVDRFVLAKLEAKGLAPNRPADRLKLLRRVSHDLTGLPPTLAEQDAFLSDDAPGAYDRAVERLLSSPRYGERWAQHWLDLVRYADTDGFKEDALRPDAHRYRDWVIRAFNAGLPYDRFVRWQLAGDELAPNEPDALIATGFNRLWPDEYNAVNLEQRRQEILDDQTDTVGLVFLGLTVGCARCHNHKYDPTTQREYFQLQSFFAAMRPREVVIADAREREEHQKKLEAWRNATREVREEIGKLLAAKVEQGRKDAIGRFNPDIRAAVHAEKPTPYQRQIAAMALKQADRAERDAHLKLDAAGKKKYAELAQKLAAFGPEPRPLPTAMAVTDVGREAPPTHRLAGGDWRKPTKEVSPGFLEFLSTESPDTSLPSEMASTGRRSALARWLTKPNHPTTARVMVNRLWQHHFGAGIVATASDFGAQGTPPTHPELLDWLAVEFVQAGWDIKHLHRLMVLSAAYRQDSVIDADAPGLAIDRENHLLWHARRRRLEGEAIRDAVLSLAGDLSPRMLGPSAKPPLPAALGKAAWKADDDAASYNRRSVYVLAKRNLRYPLFDAFDQPDMHNSCSRRLATTTAPQALMLLNGELTLGHAIAWAARLSERHTDGNATITEAYRAAWCRPPQADEVRIGVRFLERQAVAHLDAGLSQHEARAAALADFCHALMNSNEFVFVD